MIRAPAARIAPSTPLDPPLDYCLWSYTPPRASRPGDLRKAALLYHSLAGADGSDRMLAVTDAVRACFGPFGTVFGIKWAEGRLSWEFYFYDYARWDRRRGMADFTAATAGLLDVTAPPADDRPYFMFSVEIDDRHARGVQPVEQFDVYMGLPDGGVSAGACYGLTRAGFELRNLYYFYDARQQMDDARDKACATVRFDARRLVLSQLFWPEMAGAEVVVVANKRHADGLYFSRIGVDALAHFLGRLDFPAPIRAFVADNREALSHHLFDVGFDYVVEGGAVRCTKGSFYGIF